jgi:hypothetical protein
MLGLFDDPKIKAVYYRKKKELKITGLNATMVSFLNLVGNKTVKSSTRSSVIIDVKAVKDVEQALSMIEIVNEVK